MSNYFNFLSFSLKVAAFSLLALISFLYFFFPVMDMTSVTEGFYMAYLYYTKNIPTKKCAIINRDLISRYLYLTATEYLNCTVYLLFNAQHVRGVAVCNKTYILLDDTCPESCNNDVYFVFKIVPHNNTLEFYPVGIFNYTIFEKYIKNRLWKTTK